jgi:hypothetical protein
MEYLGNSFSIIIIGNKMDLVKDTNHLIAVENLLKSYLGNKKICGFVISSGSFS